MAAFVSCLAMLSTPATSIALELKAPKASAEFRLGPNDKPVDIKLTNWYCTHDAHPLDPDKEAKNILQTALSRVEGNSPDPLLRYQLYRHYSDSFFDDLDGNVRIQLQSLENSPLLSALDASLGSKRIHERRYCYSKSEVRNFVKSLANTLNIETRRAYQTMLHSLEMSESDFRQSRFSYNTPPRPDHVFSEKAHQGHVIAIQITRTATGKTPPQNNSNGVIAVPVLDIPGSAPSQPGIASGHDDTRPAADLTNSWFDPAMFEAFINASQDYQSAITTGHMTPDPLLLSFLDATNKAATEYRKFNSAKTPHTTDELAKIQTSFESLLKEFQQLPLSSKHPSPSGIEESPSKGVLDISPFSPPARSTPSPQRFTGKGKMEVGPIQTSEGELTFHILHKTRKLNSYFSVHAKVDTNEDGTYCGKGDSGCGLIFQAGYEDIYNLDTTTTYASFFYGGKLKIAVDAPGDWALTVAQKPYPRHIIEGTVKQQLVRDGKIFDIWPGSEGAVITAYSALGDKFASKADFLGNFKLTVYGDTDYRIEVVKSGYSNQELLFPSSRFSELANPGWPHKLTFALSAGKSVQSNSTATGNQASTTKDGNLPSPQAGKKVDEALAILEKMQKTFAEMLRPKKSAQNKSKPDSDAHRERLEREEERLSEQVLRQMALKNERLMNNPQADVTSYDNEITQLNKKLQAIKQQLKKGKS